MTPQAVIKKFMATLATHDYGTAADFTANILDDAIKSASNFDGIQSVIDAMKSDQVAAEREAVEEILGSNYAGLTMAEIDTSILSADAKNYAGTQISNAYLNELNDGRTTVENAIKERKAYIFLEKYCGIQLEKKYWFTTAGSDNVTSWTGDVTGNVDTGAITGSDANITLKADDSIDGATLTAANLAELAQLYGDAAKLSDDGNTIVIGTGTEKTNQGVVPEAFVNTYTARPEFSQVIDTGTRNWVVQATSTDDTITSGGADSISAGAGNDVINVNGNGATVTAGDGSDNVNISATVRDVTISDLNAQDVMTISGTFEIGSARIEDMLLVVTDSTGTRKIRFGDFTTATGATVNIGNISTTLGDWLTNAGIDINNLERTTYAESVGVEAPSTQSSSDNTEHEVYDATNNSSVAVNLATVDTSQAGNVVVNGATVGTLSSTFPNAPTFTRNGLTIHLLGSVSNIDGDPTDDNGKSLITPLTLDQLTDDQRTIIAGLFKWWGNESLKLAEDSYGIGFDSATAMVKDIGLYFYNGQDNDTLAAVWNWQKLYTDGTSDGSTTQLMLNVNMHYFSGLDASDVDGTANNQSAGMLDRTLAHEFTHAVMGTNIRYFQKLPKFIKEGSAELTHGIDDERGSTIFRIAYDSDWLDSSLVLDNTGTGSQTVGDGYSGGYMFLRYFARRAALQTLFDSEINPLLIVGTEGADSINNTLSGATIQGLGGNDSIGNNGAYVTIDGGAGDDTIRNYYAGDNVSISGGAGNDSIYNRGTSSLVDGGAGNDTIYNSGYDNVITGGTGNDRITLSATGNVVKYAAGDGFDTIYGFNESGTLSITGGAYSTVESDNDILVTVGDGSILLKDAKGKAININNSQPAPKVITLTEGDDDIYTNFQNMTILALGGNDFIDNGGNGVSISGGNGNDDISNWGSDATLNGGNGNDSIFNGHGNGYNVSINGGNGNDFIENQGDMVTINDSAGNDTIWNYGDYCGNKVSISSGSGNNSIVSTGEKVTISGGADDDYISNLGASVLFIYSDGDGSDTIDGFNATSTLSIGGGTYTTVTNGNDLIFTVGDGSILLKDAVTLSTVNIAGVYKNPLLIVGTEDADTISNTLDGATILGYDGNDSIDNGGSNVLIDGGDGADEIRNRGSNVTISGGLGNDSIVTGGHNVTISGGLGDDSIYNRGVNVRYIYSDGDGSDTITGFNETSTLQIDGGTYSTVASGKNVIVTVGDGSILLKDAVTLSTVNIAGVYNNPLLIVGTEEADTISNTLDGATILGYDGNDTIYNYGSKVTIDDGDGADEIRNRGSNVTISGGLGNDSIVTGGHNVTISGGLGDDSIYNRGVNVRYIYSDGDGSDTITGFNETSTLQIDGGNGIYSSVASGSDVVVTVGDGSILLKDAVTLSTVNIAGVYKNPLLIVGTEEADTISNTLDGATILGYDGNDTIYNYGSKVTIDDGDGADEIRNRGSNVTISGGLGNDSIVTGGHNVTISGGLGDDSIYNRGVNVRYIYSDGDGSDTITGFNETSTLQIGGGNGIYSSVASGSDVVVTVGDGSITLQGAATLATVNIAGVYDNPLSIVGAKGADVINNTLNGATIQGLGGNDNLYNSGNYVSIDGGAGNDSIRNTGSNVTISGGKGNDSIVNNGGENMLFAYNSGDGNDVIGGFNATSTLSIGGAKYTSTKSGNDLIFTVGSGKVTLQGAATLSTVNIIGDEEIVTLLTVTNSTKSPVTTDAAVKVVNASARTTAVQITGNDLANTIISGKGNDTLTGGKGNDVFIYTAGKDVITDYAVGDKISLGAAISDTAVSGNNVVFTVGKGSLTINNGKGKALALIDAKGKSSTQTISDVLTVTNSTKSPVTVPAYVKTISASARTTAVKITGNDLANTIISGKGNDTLTGGKGNDLFVYSAGKDVITDYAVGDKISLGAAISDTTISGNNVVFTVGSGSLTVNNGKGKALALIDAKGKSSTQTISDVLTVTNSTKSPVTVAPYVKTISASARTTAVKITGNDLANTIISGKGNDTLTGGKGNDVFIYTAGKDVISDYASGDKISLGAEISATAVSGNNVVFTVGKGSLTVNNAKGKKLALIDAKGKSSTQTISDVLTVTNSTKSPVTVAPYVKTINASARTTAVKITGNALANTISGGTKNDSIVGGKGNDKLYGGGKDIIYGFENDDLLQITGAFSASYNKSAKSIAFKVGKTASAITLRDFTATTFHVNDSTYQLSGSKLTRL